MIDRLFDNIENQNDVEAAAFLLGRRHHRSCVAGDTIMTEQDKVVPAGSARPRSCFSTGVGGIQAMSHLLDSHTLAASGDFAARQRVAGLRVPQRFGARH